MLGRSFSHYRICATLGHGGMGVVYLGEDTLLERQVAIKFPASGTDGDQSSERLLREARAASRLSHPNIAAVYDCGELDGQPYIVMELVRGKTLGEVIAQSAQRMMPPADACSVAAAVAEALAEAHGHGIIHRDIKPSNIMIGDRGQVKVLDFGLARRTPPLAHAAAASSEVTATMETEIAGTPPYMAPEQVRGCHVDARSDLFSLGAVLYECLTGNRPFEAPTPVESLARVLRYEPPPPSSVNSAVPVSLDHIVTKTLAKDRDARYASAEEMLACLRSAPTAPSSVVQDAAPGAPAAAAASGRRRYGRAAALTALAAIVLAIALWLVPRRPYEPGGETRRWYEEGVNALRDGTYYKAAQALSEAVRLDSRFSLASALLADAWNELDYSDRARQAMLAAMPPGETLSGVSRPELLQIQAIHRVLTHDYSGAVLKYRELTKELPDARQASALVDLGRVYEKANDLRKALDAYLDAAHRQPQFAAAFLRAGVVHRRLGDAAAAAPALDKAEQLYRALSNAEGLTEVLYQRSVLANQSSRFDEARALLDQALTMSRANGQEYQGITALLQLSSVCYRRRLFDEAREHASTALAAARRSRLDDLAARSLLELGTIAQVRGDPVEAKQRFAEALAAARGFEGRRTEARARFSLASIRIDLGEVDGSLEDAKQALAFYQGAGYSSEASRCALLLARANQKKGRYEEARSLAEAELAAARKPGDPVRTHLALEILGAVALDQERYVDALRWHTESRSVAQSSGDRLNQGWAAAATGDVYWRLGRYPEANHALADAAQMAGNDRSLQGAVELSRANMHLSEWRPAEAVAAAKRAVALAEQNQELAADAARVLASAETRSGRASNGAKLAADALRLARAMGNSRIILNALLAASEASLEAGDAAGAAGFAAEARYAAARSTQRESEWRACVLAAAAARRLARPDVEMQMITDSGALLATIRNALRPDDYKLYSARADLRRSLQRTAATMRPAGLLAADNQPQRR